MAGQQTSISAGVLMEKRPLDAVNWQARYRRLIIKIAKDQLAIQKTWRLEK